MVARNPVIADIITIYTEHPVTMGAMTAALGIIIIAVALIVRR